MDGNIVNSEAARLAHKIAGYSHRPVEEVVAQAVRELAERALPREERQDYTSGLKGGGAKADKPLHERIADNSEACCGLAGAR